MFQAERAFVNNAEADMAWLSQAYASMPADFPARDSELPTDGDSENYIPVSAQLGASSLDALASIRTGARTVRARGIEMAALRCEQILNNRPARFEVLIREALYTLNRLIGQYTNGLNEIDTPDNVVQAFTAQPEQADEGEAQLSVTEKFIAAQALLAPLLAFAPDDEHFALKTLMSVCVDNTVTNELSSEIAASEIATSECADETVIETTRDIRLESLMGPITDTVLGMAHRSGKVVSISYAVGDDMVSSAQSLELQNQLVGVCGVLVEQALPSSKAKGEAARTGQISISAVKRAGTLCLDVCDNGMPLGRDSFNRFETVELMPNPAGGNRIVVPLEAMQARSEMGCVENADADDEETLLDVFETDLSSLADPDQASSSKLTYIG